MLDYKPASNPETSASSQTLQVVHADTSTIDAGNLADDEGATGTKAAGTSGDVVMTETD